MVGVLSPWCGSRISFLAFELSKHTRGICNFKKCFEV